jgi:hypothetical protein
VELWLIDGEVLENAGQAQLEHSTTVVVTLQCCMPVYGLVAGRSNDCLSLNTPHGVYGVFQCHHAAQLLIPCFLRLLFFQPRCFHLLFSDRAISAHSFVRSCGSRLAADDKVLCRDWPLLLLHILQRSAYI